MTVPNMNLSQNKSEHLEVTGYVMRVVSARVEQNYGGRLVLELDIAEGPNEGYYQRLSDRAGFWGMTLNLYFDEKQAWKFSRAIEAFRKSNDSLIWEDDAENDEQNLVGKLIGIVPRLKEYIGNDGQKKTKLMPYTTVPVSDIRTGQFTVPEPVKADEPTYAQASANVVDRTGEAPSGFTAADDGIPF